MMTITEKVAYLKGLAEGAKLSDATTEGKILMAVIDVLDDMAMTVSDVEDSVAEMSQQVDEIDDDLAAIEEEWYDDEGEDDDDEDDDDDEMYEIVCPKCGDIINLDGDMLDEGSINCPNCGESLEFDIDDCECDDDCGCDHCKE
ncbi:MAG: hypothetical protein RR185_05745 [Angelakisella sp.]